MKLNKIFTNSKVSKDNGAYQYASFIQLFIIYNTSSNSRPSAKHLQFHWIPALAELNGMEV